MAYSCIIITIGDELLIGQTIDTNSAWIAHELNNIGIHIKRRIAVADEASAITEALDESIPKAELVILTGGLGPTADDITKPLLCEYFGGKMVINQEVLEHIRHLFIARNRPPLERNLKQAEVPDNAIILPNRMGTAPGMWFKKEQSVIISLPGVPFEMQAIMSEEVIPQLKDLFQGNHIIHKTLITIGVGESIIADKIEDIESNLPPTISLAYLPAPGYVKLRLSTQGQDNEYLEKQVNSYSQLIQNRLGNIVAAERDSPLEEIIGNLFISRQLTLALAESCTGGHLSNLLTNRAGSSAYFKGSIISYANEVKQDLLKVSEQILQTEGAVSEATVIQMAREAKILLKADIALSLSGILGPGGATPEKQIGLVWIALAHKDIVITKKFTFYYDRLRNKELAAHAAINMLRLFIGDLQ